MVRVVCAALTVALTLGLASASGQTTNQSTRTFWTTTGIAKNVSVSSLTIEAAGGGVMTFTVTSSTRFVGKGLARDLLLRDPRMVVARAVKAGDQVKVTYRSVDGAPNAVEIRVVQKSLR